MLNNMFFPALSSSKYIQNELIRVDCSMFQCSPSPAIYCMVKDQGHPTDSSSLPSGDDLH